MARMTTVQRAHRVLTFLMGLRDPCIAAALRRHGFTEADRADGYARIARLTEGSLHAPRPAPPEDRERLQRLDAWENRWFPIASATLQYRFPEVHERVFRNLSQTRGPELILAVGTLVQRLDELGEAGHPEASSALDLLAQRGLDADTIDEGRRLLRQVMEPAPAPSGPEPDTDAIAHAETELWNWYLEWSAIARAAIKSRRQLRLLGYLGGRPEPVPDDA